MKKNYQNKNKYVSSEREPRSLGCYPTEFAGSTKNPKKMIGTQTKTKIFPKIKYV
jgi:hypothetical protein